MDVDEGRSLSEVAAAVGISATTVRRVLADFGVERRPQNARRDVDVAALVARYQAGATMAEIAIETGVSESLVRDRLLEADVTPRAQQRRPVSQRPATT